MEQRATIQEMPLFPLDMVLFPGMPQALHIFEPRYRRMVARCLQEEIAFGIVAVKNGLAEGVAAVPYDIGTVARIVNHARMADGRYNLVTIGAARFQILERHQHRGGYLMGRVELLDEEEHDAHRLVELRAVVERRFERYIGQYAEIVGGEVKPITFPTDPTAASYFVAANLNLDTWERQRLLEATSTDVRLLEERRILGRERDILRLYAKARAPYEDIVGLDGDPDNLRTPLSPN